MSCHVIASVVSPETIDLCQIGSPGESMEFVMVEENGAVCVEEKFMFHESELMVG
jgi:hypothetical protein